MPARVKKLASASREMVESNHVGDGQGLHAILLRDALGGRGVSGLARLSNGDDQRSFAVGRLAVAEFAGVLDFHRNARQVLDHEFAAQSRVAAGAAGHDGDPPQGGDFGGVQGKRSGRTARVSGSTCCRMVCRMASGCSYTSFSIWYGKSRVIPDWPDRDTATAPLESWGTTPPTTARPHPTNLPKKINNDHKYDHKRSFCYTQRRATVALSVG